MVTESESSVRTKLIRPGLVVDPATPRICRKHFITVLSQTIQMFLILRNPDLVFIIYILRSSRFFLEFIQVLILGDLQARI